MWLCVISAGCIFGKNVASYSITSPGHLLTGQRNYYHPYAGPFPSLVFCWSKFATRFDFPEFLSRDAWPR